MSRSNNIEYAVLKKRAGLHNWAFMPSREELEEEEGFDLDAGLDEFPVEQAIDSQEILHENDHGEFYALQDFEE